MSVPRVIHVSTTDTRGGAALCAYRLHTALRGIGHPSEMFVGQRYTDEPGIREYNPLAPAPPGLGRRWFRLARRLERPPLERTGAYFSFDRSLAGRRLAAQLPACDLVNLHWVADLLDYRTLPVLARRGALVWTFHDMNSFTGGCHYSGACLRYREACGSCPQLKISGGPDDPTHRCLERKRRILGTIPPERLAVVCPSHWLAGEARRSAVFGNFDVTVIPSGLDVEQFRPIDRAAARRRFGLPPEARIVLFVAENIGDRRKGLEFLLPAIADLRGRPDLLFVTIGRADVQRLSDPVFRHLGSLSGSEALAAVYSAADVFVVPSLEDNFPNTALEAMACGTPVVGFASGGIPEAVVDGRTGLLAATGDGPGLVPLLRRVLDDRRLQRDLGRGARARATEEYGLPLYARRYAELYQRRWHGRETAGAESRAEGLAAR